MKILSFYKRLMRIVCAVGCVYQTYNLSRIYFSYETTTNVKYETISDTYLPAITVCSPTKYTQFQDKYLDEYGKFHLSEKFTIKEQFKAMKDSPYKLAECWVSSAKGNGDCQGASNYSQYFNMYAYCFTIFPQLDGQSDDLYKIEEFEKTLAYFFLRREKDDSSNPEDKIFIYLHSRDQTLMKNEEDGAIIMSLNNFAEATLEYYVVIIHYMFKPFGQCFEGQTRSQCIYKCIVDQIIEKYDKYPDIYLSKDRESELNFGESDEFVYNEDQCKQICDLKTECLKQFFVNNHMSMENHDSERVKITINKPSFPATIYQVKLKMGLEEYFCMLSSVYSLWFGFSVVLFTDFCPVMLKKFRFYLVQHYKLKLVQKNKAIIKVNHCGRGAAVKSSRRF